MKKAIIIVYLIFYSLSLFAQTPENSFEINESGIITKYTGWDTEVVIPGKIKGITVTGIGDKAFEACEITKVTIPNTVIYIGESAFSRNKLTTITVPGNNLFIEENAFNDNQIKEAFITGDNVVYYNSNFGVFDNNPIIKITLVNNHRFRYDLVPKINWNRSNLHYYYVCNGRKRGTYTTNVAAIIKREGDYSYVETPNGAYIITYHGTGGNRISIPGIIGGLQVKAIGGLNNNNIGGVQIPNGIMYIDDGAFSNNGMTQVIIPNSLIYIGVDAFASNQLTSVNIPNNITHINALSFRHNKLSNITISNSVKHIDSESFTSNFEIESITIGENVFLNNDNNKYRCLEKNFDVFYIESGKKAGTYSYTDGKWTRK